MIKRKLSEETKRKISESKKKNPTKYWLGRKLLPHMIEALKKSNKGRKPWHAGTKGLKKAPSTAFKKGHKSWLIGTKGLVKPNNGNFQKNHIPWNKGKKITLTKFKGKTYEEIFGKERAIEIKRKIGLKSLGRKARLGIPFTPEQLRKVLIIRTPNKDELKLNRILKTNFPREWKFVGNGRVIIEGKNPDFININGKKQIIELYGKRWHEESEVEPRKELFAKYGYKTLIIWDYELKNEKEIIQKVVNL